MDSTLTGAWIGAVAGLTVWFFNWLWMLWGEHKLRKRIRTMISIEIEDNIEMLDTFYAAVRNAIRFNEDSALAGMQKADVLSMLPLPIWNYRIWESLTTSIPLALNGDEIRAVHLQHKRFDELTRLKSIKPDSLYDWTKEFEAAISNILQMNNPLNAQKVLEETHNENIKIRSKNAI